MPRQQEEVQHLMAEERLKSSEAVRHAVDDAQKVVRRSLAEEHQVTILNFSFFYISISFFVFCVQIFKKIKKTFRWWSAVSILAEKF